MVATMTTRTKSILDRLVRVVPKALEQITKPGPHCVLSTSVGQTVLERLGIPSEPYPVEIKICNQAWMEWAEDNYAGGREAQLRRGAYLLCNSPNWQGASFKSVIVDKPWDGHLVLKVPDGDRVWLVDLDIGAFSRPAQNVRLPSAMLAVLPSDGQLAGTFTKGLTQTHVVYAPLVAPYRDDYQTSRDWVERDRFAEVIEKIVRAVK